MNAAVPPNGYVYVEEIGKGAFSTVYKGKNISTDQVVAIKVIKKDEKHQKAKESFNEEALLLKQLYHRNIVHFVSIIEGEFADYLIMENVKGKTLKKYIYNNGKMSEDDARFTFLQIIDAISYFHDTTGFLHRDLKADNIMIDPETKKIKIIDFGLAGKYSKTSTNRFCGSPSMYFNLYAFSHALIPYITIFVMFWSELRREKGAYLMIFTKTNPQDMYLLKCIQEFHIHLALTSGVWALFFILWFAEVSRSRQNRSNLFLFLLDSRSQVIRTISQRISLSSLRQCCKRRRKKGQHLKR
jgi:predicted Ser/Thr protein kinase